VLGLAIDVQETNDKCKHAVQSKDEQLATKDKEITRTAARINEQDLEIQSLKKQISTLDEENHKKDLEIRALNGQLTGNSDEIQELKKRLTKYVAEIEELKRQIATSDEENHKKDLEIRALKGQLIGNSNEIQELKKRLAKYVAEIEELKALHDGLHSSKAVNSDLMEALRQRASGLAPPYICPVCFYPRLCCPAVTGILYTTYTRVASKHTKSVPLAASLIHKMMTSNPAALA
jgi:chromosome segregation ATPase